MAKKKEKKPMQSTAAPVEPQTGRVARSDSKGRKRPDQRFRPVDPATVEAIPPWDRDEFRYHEVPAVLKRLYNFTVRVETVYRWMKVGRADKSGSGQTLYLNHTMKLGRLFVKKADLLRFMELT